MASTTVVPFANLPACAANCGPLYDVNGACVPPAATSAAATAYEQCFCSDARLAAFSTTTGGVCDAACTADAAGYGSLTSWYQSMCSSVQALAADGTTSSGSSTTGSSSSSGSKSGGGGSWLDNHWQWVIFIVVMVVGIAGIWIGAAIWRRHYLRKKDRQYALGKNLARRTGSGQNPYGGGGGGAGSTTPTRSGSLMQPSQQPQRPGAGMFMPASLSSANVYEEKPPKAKKKWNLTG